MQCQHIFNLCNILASLPAYAGKEAENAQYKA